MKQREIVEDVCMVLLRNGYTVKSLVKSCFDIVARGDDKLLVVKSVEDANSLSKEMIGEMIKVADYLGAVPVIVSEKAGFLLERNIVYMRYGVYTLNPDTFENSVLNKMPFIKSSKAGQTVQLDAEQLRKRREEMGYSLNALAAKLGVSSKMVQRYERGDAEITIQKAVRMHDCLGNDVFKRIDVFAQNKVLLPTGTEGAVSKKYHSLGFKAEEMKRSPFDIIAKRKKEIVLTGIGDRVNPHAQKVSEMVDADRLMIYKKKKPKDIPSMKKKEFLEIDKAKALIRFLKEF